MDASEIRKGYQTFQAHEARDAMYKTATFLVTTFWGQPKEMADSLGVLLLTWNQAFYRYGFFDFNALEECIACHQEVLGKYRNRNILTYTNNDDPVIQLLYTHFMSALRIANGS